VCLADWRWNTACTGSATAAAAGPDSKRLAINTLNVSDFRIIDSRLDLGGGTQQPPHA
jgi:hypothetical protein